MANSADVKVKFASPLKEPIKEILEAVNRDWRKVREITTQIHEDIEKDMRAFYSSGENILLLMDVWEALRHAEWYIHTTQGYNDRQDVAHRLESGQWEYRRIRAQLEGMQALGQEILRYIHLRAERTKELNDAEFFQFAGNSLRGGEQDSSGREQEVKSEE